jgi:hypothetical protein
LWILAGLLLLAFAARVFNSNDGFARDGEVLIARNDASYHARRALYTFENFPRILWFDAYLAYPDGAPVPVPPLYDWTLAAVARAFASTQRGFERVVAWSPPLLGALTLLPVFFTGRRLGGPQVGLLAAGILALLPLHAEFARLGNADHHAMVALIAACWLALIVRAALGEERRRAAAVALRAAVLATMLLTWSGSLLLLVLAEGSALAAWVVLGGALPLRKQALAAATAAALVAPWVAVAPTPVGGPFSSTTLSWLHPLVLLGLAGVGAGLAVLEGRRRSRDALERGLRAGVVGLAIAGALFVLLPLSEALAPGVRFVAGADRWRLGNVEQAPLFSALGKPGSQLGPPHRHYGAFAYLIPFAPLALVPLLRQRVRDSRRDQLCPVAGCLRPLDRRALPSVARAGGARRGGSRRTAARARVPGVLPEAHRQGGEEARGRGARASSARSQRRAVPPDGRVAARDSRDIRLPGRRQAGVRSPGQSGSRPRHVVPRPPGHAGEQLRPLSRP